MRQLALTMSLVLGASLLLGCGPRYEVYEGPLTPAEREPSWVSRGPGEFGRWDEKGIYAVGVASEEPNTEIRQAKALTNARVELARQFELYVAELIRTLNSKIEPYWEPQDRGCDQFLRELSASVGEQQLGEAKEIALWYCAITDEQFALIRLSEKDFLNAFRAEAEKQVQQQDASPFGERTEEALKKLRDALERVYARRARGLLEQAADRRAPD